MRAMATAAVCCSETVRVDSTVPRTPRTWAPIDDDHGLGDLPHAAAKVCQVVIEIKAASMNTL